MIVADFCVVDSLGNKVVTTKYIFGLYINIASLRLDDYI